MTAELEGRVAVVTGALGKLGPAWISALAKAGATVIGIDLRSGEVDGAARVEIADVTDREALLAVRERVEADHGVPDVLVNNAGIDQPPAADAGTTAIEDVPLDDFRRTLDVNVAGTFLATQIFGSRMRDAGRGSIVNIGSLYASIAADPRLYDHLDLDPPFLKPPAYGASKAGTVDLTRYFARLWGPHGVRVNSLSPGGVRGGQDDEFVRKFTARTPLGRLAETDDLDRPAALPRLGCVAVRHGTRAPRGRRFHRVSVATATMTVADVIDGEERPAASGATFEKRSPATGEVLSVVARSEAPDVDAAVSAAAEAQPAWADRTVVERGRILRRIAQLLERDREAIAAVVSAETGKSPKDARGETDGAIELGYFIAGEGRRFYGRTIPSATPNRQARDDSTAARRGRADHRGEHADRERGLEGLSRVALRKQRRPQGIRGHAADRARLRPARGRSRAAPGVLNVVHGFGAEAGQPLVEDRRVAVVSFTGSTAVGRMIARVAGERLAKVCLELGGKNPLVVCDDADLERAAETAALFRLLECRPALRGRIPADRVRRGLRPLSGAPARTDALQRVGSGRRARDFGPVINERQPANMLAAVGTGAGGRRERDRGRRASRRRGLRGWLLHGTDGRRGGRAPRRSSRARTLRPDHDPAPGGGLRRGARPREHEPVRTDGGDLDGEHRPWARASSGAWSREAFRSTGRRTGSSRMSVRRRARLGHWLARAGDRGSRRLLRLENGVNRARPGAV